MDELSRVPMRRWIATMTVSATSFDEEVTIRKVEIISRDRRIEGHVAEHAFSSQFAGE